MNTVTVQNYLLSLSIHNEVEATIQYSYGLFFNINK